jgi:hypothetical protein
MNRDRISGELPAGPPASPRLREQRAATARSRTTNDPLRWPVGLHPQSGVARRWRDLATHYAAQLGPERMAREDVRTRLRSVLWLSVEVDRLQGERLCDRPVPLHSVLHAAQELKALLNELGLSEPTNSNSDGLAQLLRNGGGAGP